MWDVDQVKWYLFKKYIYISQWQYINMIMTIINSVNKIKKGSRNENTNLLQLFFSIPNKTGSGWTMRPYHFESPLKQTYCWFTHCSKYTLFSSHNTSCWKYFKTFYTRIITLYFAQINLKFSSKPHTVAETQLFSNNDFNQSKVVCFPKDGAWTNQKSDTPLC